ncbi:MAG: hypothetical protein JO356_01745 [Acidobacteria bacterium]|nr:hypothetical protein [Acidobacteriota bacterium]
MVTFVTFGVAADCPDPFAGALLHSGHASLPGFCMPAECSARFVCAGLCAEIDSEFTSHIADFQEGAHGLIECRATNADDNRYCGKCGAELGRTLDETVRKKGFGDRQATEMEITAAVVETFRKWAGWLGSATGLILALFAFMLGWSYHDLKQAVNSEEAKIPSLSMKASGTSMN